MNILETILIFGKSMVMMDIPYNKHEKGIKQFPGKPEYYCVLDADIVDKLSRSEVVSLRDSLELATSIQVGKSMELGFAHYALNKQCEYAVICYFKEIGVAQCQ